MDYQGYKKVVDRFQSPGLLKKVNHIIASAKRYYPDPVI